MLGYMILLLVLVICGLLYESFRQKESLKLLREEMLTLQQGDGYVDDDNKRELMMILSSIKPEEPESVIQIEAVETDDNVDDKNNDD